MMTESKASPTKSHGETPSEPEQVDPRAKRLMAVHAAHEKRRKANVAK